ncbi:uncharacterized protein J3D65DRAFT_470656 [Phyllosticta citribraziliensis]|uniref:Uncharacterized protein n=1 Tax=Phyllosticta citribraziliensis TaxID=989973 RepID=A0ABR1LH94_9PEZI
MMRQASEWELTRLRTCTDAFLFPPVVPLMKRQVDPFQAHRAATAPRSSRRRRRSRPAICCRHPAQTARREELRSKMTASMCAPMAMNGNQMDGLPCHSNPPPPPTPPVQDLLAPTPRPRSPPNLTVLLEIFAPSPPQTTHTMMPTTCCHSSGARISRPVLSCRRNRAAPSSRLSRRPAWHWQHPRQRQRQLISPGDCRTNHDPFAKRPDGFPQKMSSPSQACLSLDDAASQIPT